MEKSYVIGIDIGGTKIAGILGDITGHILGETTLPTLAHQGSQAVIMQMLSCIRILLHDYKLSSTDISAIGIGSPGSLLPDQGIALNASNIPYNNTSLTGPIMDAFGISAYLDNDANIAAMGEYFFGAGKGSNNMVYVTVSTGIGGGAILNGEIYRGASCNALEIGHSIIDANSPHRCKCGNYGDAEALCSGTAIMNRAAEAIASPKDTSLKKYTHPTAAEVFIEYQNQDPVAIEILDTAFDYLGITLANIMVSFDPDLIVIGGGVTSIGSLLIEKAEHSMRKRSFPVFFQKVRILPAALGKSVGTKGAMALAILKSGGKII